MVRKYSQNPEESSLSSINDVLSADGSPLKKGEQTQAIYILGKEVARLSDELRVAVDKTRTEVEGKTEGIIAQAKIEARSVAQESTAGIVETIGVFAALLAFISFEAQIFRGPLSAFAIVGASAIFFSALFILTLLLDITFNGYGEKNTWWRALLFGFASLCLVGGGIVAVYGYKNSESFAPEWAQSVKKDLQSDYVDQISSLRHTITNDELLIFKNCIATKGLYACLGN